MEKTELVEGTTCTRVLRQEGTWSIWGTGRSLDLNHYLSDAQRVNGAERVRTTQVHRRLESKAKVITGRALKVMLRT